MNPFKLMDLLGEWLYVATDKETSPTMKDMPWILNGLSNCYGHATFAQLEELMQMDTVYNAGVIGGTRELMLTTLARLIGYLDIAVPKMNCNMPAVNIAVHRHFFDDIFTGYPLNSRFNSNGNRFQQEECTSFTNNKNSE